MSEKTDLNIAKQPVKATDLIAPDVDVSAVLSDHMYKFVYGPSPHLTDAVSQLDGLANFSADQTRNAVTLGSIERQSGNVKDDLQNHALVVAERDQRKVVALADQLDLGAISSAIASASRGSGERFGALLKAAGATPLVERVRLGAIQMRQSHEIDAEQTFDAAWRADIAKESKNLPEVMELKRAAQKMSEELKLRRTLPEVFDNNLTLIDTVVKDGALSREELLNSMKRGVETGMTQTLVEYLLKNFDQIKNGNDSIDHNAVVAYQKKILPKGFGR